MLRGIRVEQGRIECQVSQLRNELREHGVHIRLDDEVVVQWLHVLLLTSYLFPLTSLLQILLRLLGGHHRGKVTLMIGIQFRLDIDGQERLPSEHL